MKYTKKLFLENAKIYFVKEEKPDENINDVKAYHYLIVLNNDERYQFGENIRRKYMVSYGLSNGEDCDIIF